MPWWKKAPAQKVSDTVGTVSSPERHFKEPPVRILSLDGGGIRGLLPALILEEIEERTGASARDLFDVVAGCSTGGLIALGLFNQKRPLKASTIVEIYRQDAKKVFRGAPINKIPGSRFVRVRYDTDGLRELVCDLIPESETLGRTHKRLLIPAVDLDLRQLEVFDSARPGSRLKMIDVALATTAAPTYFDPHEIKFNEGDSTRIFVDGGIAANDPSAIVVTRFWEEIRRRGVVLVSLGTGRVEADVDRDDFRGSGAIGWGNELPGLAIDSSSDATSDVIRELLRSSGLPPERRTYLRINPTLGSRIKLDDTSDDTITALYTARNRWKADEDRKAELLRVCELLKAGSGSA